MRALKSGIVLIACILCFFFSANVFAEDACNIAGVKDALICGTEGGDEEVELMGRISNILNVVYLWIGIIAVIFMVIGGISYMTSQGESQKIQRAKATITYSLCGLIVTLAAFAITSTIINSLDGVSPDKIVADDGSGGVLGADRYKVKGISSVGQTKVIAGQSVTIHAKVVPDYAENKKLSYKSSDNNIATVDENGLVTSKKDGEVTITISSPDGPSKKVKIIVLKPIPVTEIKLSSKDVDLKKNETITIKATALPANATDKTLIWSSANDKVAVVTQAGVIRGLKEGESTTVTVTARNQNVIASRATDIRMADFELATATPVKATINVSIMGSKLNFGYTGNGSVKAQFSSANMKIIEKHLYDLNYNNYHDVLNKKYGGSFKNYAKDVGGIFGDYYDRIVKVKTEYEFQLVSEYVFGWMYMIGFDYDSPDHYAKWGSGGGNTHSSDAFFPGTMRYQGAWGGKGIDKALASSDGHDRAMMTQCGPTIDMIYEKVGINRNAMVKNNTVKYISRFKDLKVGDKFNFFDNPVKKNPSSPTERWSLWTNGRHVTMVGEVYKDKIVIYDGGSYYMNNRKFKRTLKIPDTEAGEYAEVRREFGFGGWSAERFINLTK